MIGFFMEVRFLFYALVFAAVLSCRAGDSVQVFDGRPAIVSGRYSLQKINFVEEEVPYHEDLATRKTKTSSSMLLAVIEATFDQPMYVRTKTVGGNGAANRTSAKLTSLADEEAIRGMLRGISYLQCQGNGSKVYESYEKDPMGITAIPYFKNKSSGLLPFTSIIEGKLREDSLYPEVNVYRGCIVLSIERFGAKDGKSDMGDEEDLVNLPRDQLGTCKLTFRNTVKQTVHEFGNSSDALSSLVNEDGLALKRPSVTLSKDANKDTHVHDIFFSSKAHGRNSMPVPTAIIEEALMENNFLGMGNPMAPETFVEPVANQAERDGMPRLVNMLQEFLKPVLSATIGRFFTGFDSDQKAPEVPTFLAEKGAEEAASVAELVMSLGDQKAKDASYDAAIAAGIAAEAAAYAVAVAKAAGLKPVAALKMQAFIKRIEAINFVEIDKREKAVTANSSAAASDSTAVEGEGDKDRAFCMEHPRSKGCFAVGMEELSKKFKGHVDDSLEKAEGLYAQSRRCKIVSSQTLSTAKHYQQLAKKTRENIQETYEYRLLKLSRKVIGLSKNASIAAHDCSKSSRKAAKKHTGVANYIINVSKSMVGQMLEKNMSVHHFQKHFPLNKTISKVSTRIEFLETYGGEEEVLVDSARSRMVLNEFVSESFRNHQQGMASVRIEADQWDELRVGSDPKKPKQPLGFSQKTLVHKLSHSLTTELSDKLTRSLTTYITNNLQGILGDVLSGIVPKMVSQGITQATVPGVSNAVSYTVTTAVLHLLPLMLTASTQSVLTNTLTRALTHSLSASLTHTLRYNPEQEKICYQCRKEKKNCHLCKMTLKAETEAEYYLNHDAAYFSDYYALYYNGVGNPRPSRL
jgi:hypothetical protein